MANIESVRLPNGSEYNLQDVVTPRTAASQPNLLINPWFTVNQRGQNSYSGNTIYTVDRWYINNAPTATVTVTNDGLTINANGVRTWEQQKIENYSDLVGRTVTLSVMKKDGTIYQSTAVVPTPTSTETAFLDEWFDNNTIRLAVFISTSSFIVGVGVENGSTKYLRAVKLEVGDTSTLHLDTAPDYTTELLKCQRYFISLQLTARNMPAMLATIWNNTLAFGYIHMAVPMRVIPTLTTSGTFRFRTAGNNNAVSDISLVAEASGTQELYLLITSSSLTPGMSGMLAVDGSSAIMQFSAEL